MKRATVEQAVVWMGLVAATVGLRIWLREIPNFAPVAGVALFAGYYFRNGWLAALAPLSVMVISDLSLGGYQPLLMLTVYSLLTLPVVLRGYLRSRFQLDGSAQRPEFARRPVDLQPGLLAAVLCRDEPDCLGGDALVSAFGGRPAAVLRQCDPVLPLHGSGRPVVCRPAVWRVCRAAGGGATPSPGLASADGLRLRF